MRQQTTLAGKSTSYIISPPKVAKVSMPNETPDNKPRSRSRRGRRQTNGEQGTGSLKPSVPSNTGLEGGRYQPMNEAQMKQIDLAVRSILDQVGISEAPPIVIEKLCAAGARLNEDGRITFPAALFDRALAGLTRNFTLHGQKPGHEMLMSGKRVHVGSGGAAPMVVDLHTGKYRDSTLQDLYDAARLVDAMDNIHFFSRSMVARDMPDDLSLDINTAYASLAGTQKHVFVQATFPAHVERIAEICYRIAGSRQAFVDRPFLSININHAVAPMRYATDACEVMAEAARLGIPIHANSFGQLGASSPVTIAGSIVQNVAEVLSGMFFAWLVNPDARVTFGSRPMITDLRTGGMTGGSGEQAQLMAAATQMAQYYDLPNTCIAGATDSKIADAQSGYEKSLSVSLAALVGSNAITQACGMHASLLGCALESYVIDNDMLGGILRSISPLEVNEVTLATEAIGEVVRGDGHFLGHKETLNRMQSDFLYPEIADRRTPQEWEQDGGRDIRELAREKTVSILDTHFPNHIPASIDAELRSMFDIRLPRDAMMKS
jgi:trimethylamine--corrinoid protein Co-methyltransferase